MDELEKLKALQDRWGRHRARLEYSAGKWCVFIGYDFDEFSDIETDFYDTASEAVEAAEEMVDENLGTHVSADAKLAAMKAKAEEAWAEYAIYYRAGGGDDFWDWFQKRYG